MQRTLLLLAVAAAQSEYGGSEYGYWTPDTFGNPSFVFEGGMSNSAGAVYLTDAQAVHRAGNDRVEVLAFSDGTLSLRQDEGGPKLLNGYNISAQQYQFRGGYGYLCDSSAVLAATAVAGTVGVAPQPASYNLSLTLGMGFVSKRVTASTSNGNTVTVDHSVWAPFGDVTVALSLVDVTAPQAQEPLTFTEVWSAGDRWELGWGGLGSVVMPADYQQHWLHNVSTVRVGGSSSSGPIIGLVDAAALPPSAPHTSSSTKGRQADGTPIPSLHDPDPRPAFLVCLSCLTGGSSWLRSFTTAGEQLFCSNSNNGGSSQPCANATIDAPVVYQSGQLVAGLDNSTAGSAVRGGNVLALQAAFTPAPNNTSTRLGFLYGYLLQSDVAPYGNDLSAAVWAKIQPWLPAASGSSSGGSGGWSVEDAVTAAAWAAYASDVSWGTAAPTTATTTDTAARAAAAAHPREHAVAAVAQRTSTPAPVAAGSGSGASYSSWEGREAQWSSYMLRSGLTYDDFYSAHIINQNGNYLYLDGTQAAQRDPLAYAAVFAYGGASVAPYLLEVCVMTMAERRTQADSQGRPAGSIPWGRAAWGMDASATFNQSDIELAYLMTLTDYVLASRDVAALNRTQLSWNNTQLSLGEASWLAFLHLRDVIGVGQHGLIRLLRSDHNDGLFSSLNVSQTPAIMATAESGMDAGLAAHVLPAYAAVLNASGADAVDISTVLDWAASQASALNAYAWNSNATAGWYRRAFLGNASDPQLSWRGDVSTDMQLWSETQSWAILGGVPSAVPGRLQQVLAALDSWMLSPSPLGAINARAPAPMVDVGVAYSGIWYCGQLALIAALARVGYGDMALQQWRKGSLAVHAATYPQIWYGVTSGADVTSSILAAAPGATRCHWNDPRPGTPADRCEEAAFPILNGWSHTTGTYTLPSLMGAAPDATGMLLQPTISTQANYTIWTPTLSLSRTAAGSSSSNATCGYGGTWVPLLAAGQIVTLRLVLPPADFALCTSVQVNGAPAPLVVGATAFTVIITAPLAAMGSPATPMLVWQLA